MALDVVGVVDTFSQVSLFFLHEPPGDFWDVRVVQVLGSFDELLFLHFNILSFYLLPVFFPNFLSLAKNSEQSGYGDFEFP